MNTGVGRGLGVLGVLSIFFTTASSAQASGLCVSELIYPSVEKGPTAEERAANREYLKQYQGIARLAYEFEIYPKRMWRLVKYLDRPPIEAWMRSHEGWYDRTYTKNKEFLDRYFDSKQARELVELAPGENFEKLSPAQKLKRMPPEKMPDYLFAISLDGAITAKSAFQRPAMNWAENAPEQLKSFAWGSDQDIIEMRTRPEITDFATPLESMRTMVSALSAENLLFVKTLQDDVTEGLEWHYHLSFPGDAVLQSRLFERAPRLNRLYLLESLGRGNSDIALFVRLESYTSAVTRRGIVRLLKNRLETRWHHTDPESELANIIRYLNLDDATFESTVRAREAALIGNGKQVIQRIANAKPGILARDFKDWKNDPEYAAQVRRARKSDPGAQP